MATDREFSEEVREGRWGYWRAPLVIAVLAWVLFLMITFLTGLGVVALWSADQVFSSAVFLLVGVIAGTLGYSARSKTPSSRREDRNK